MFNKCHPIIISRSATGGKLLLLLWACDWLSYSYLPSCRFVQKLLRLTQLCRFHVINGQIKAEILVLKMIIISFFQTQAKSDDVGASGTRGRCQRSASPAGGGTPQGRGWTLPPAIQVRYCSLGEQTHKSFNK